MFFEKLNKFKHFKLTHAIFEKLNNLKHIKLAHAIFSIA